MITTMKLSMLALLLAALPPEDGTATLWAQWGLAGVVVGFVLVRDHQREKRMAAALEARDAFIREQFAGNLKRMDTPMNGTKRGKQ